MDCYIFGGIKAKNPSLRDVFLQFYPSLRDIFLQFYLSLRDIFLQFYLSLRDIFVILNLYKIQGSNFYENSEPP